MEFQICDAAGGQFYWRIVAGNGEVLAHSETHPRKQTCLNAIHVVQSGAATAPIYDMTSSARR